MSRYRRRGLAFNPTCPSGGTWYSCAESHFVGCCASDPCSNGCTQGNIRPASFDANYYEKFPDGSCSLGSKFYTCAANGETFWGCCKSDPCGPTPQCPSGELVPAFIDRPEQTLAYSPTGGASSTSTSSSSTTSRSSTTTTTTSASSSSSSSTSSMPSLSAASTNAATMTITATSKGGSHTAAIAGGAAGGGVGIAIAIGLIVYLILHTRKSRKEHKDGLERRQSDRTAPMPGKHDMDPSPTLPVLSPYASSGPNTYPHDPDNWVYQQQHELSAMPSSPHPPWRTVYPHRLSELSGDTAQGTNVDSPVQPSPYAYSTPQSPHSTGAESPNWTKHAREAQHPQSSVDNRNQIYAGGYEQDLSGYHGR